jgi:hypothetical protein
MPRRAWRTGSRWFSVAKRPVLDKKVNRLRKALRNTPPAFIDLEDWLIDRKYVQTKGAARKLLLDGKVKVESHTVGRIALDVNIGGDDEGKKYVLYPFIPAQYRNDITVAK